MPADKPVIWRHALSVAEFTRRMTPATCGHTPTLTHAVRAMTVNNGMVSWDLTGPADCAGCGAHLVIDPHSTMTAEQIADPDQPITVDYRYFDPATSRFTPTGDCEGARPIDYTVRIPVPSGRLLISNYLFESVNPLHYDSDYSSGGPRPSINSVRGRRIKTRTCATEYGYGTVSTTCDVQVLQASATELLFEHAWAEQEELTPAARAATPLGQPDLDVWAVEMMDLQAYCQAADLDLDDVTALKGVLIAKITPGTYALTVRNEAYERLERDCGAGLEHTAAQEMAAGSSVAQLELTED